MDIKDLLKKLSPAAAAAALLLAGEVGTQSPTMAREYEAAARLAKDARAPSTDPLVLTKATETVQLAQHRSHRSHSSHRSHRSHYSNRV
ncbi:MAG: hypothetical protein RLP09_26865 [Sandaracinaceae bacterium]|nr:hypothetical protein [Myxococcales bacterium]